MGRRTKTLLPIATKMLETKHVEPKKIHDKLTSLRTQQKRYHDRGTKPLESNCNFDLEMQPDCRRLKAGDQQKLYASMRVLGHMLSSLENWHMNIAAARTD